MGLRAADRAPQSSATAGPPPRAEGRRRLRSPGRPAPPPAESALASRWPSPAGPILLTAGRWRDR
eukprot:1768223-Pyramimonas_sp.AAC.1